MHSLIRKCRVCNNYTLDETCGKCDSITDVALPPRYSPVDRFQKYRIVMKEGSNDGKDHNKSI